MVPRCFPSHRTLSPDGRSSVRDQARLCPMLLGMAAPALAVQFGEPDTNPERFKGVALIVFFVGGVPSHLCTGTLIDDDSVLTAAHCTDGTSGALVGLISTTEPLVASLEPYRSQSRVPLIPIRTGRPRESISEW